MKRESLLNLRTSRDILTSLDAARTWRAAPTMFQRMRRIIARSTKEITPHLNEAILAIELNKERLRFKRRWQSRERGYTKILGFRQKLANTHEKHKRIMGLRVALQRQYWNDTSRLTPRSEQTVGVAASTKFLAAPAASPGKSRISGASTGETTPRFKVKRLRYGGKS